MIVRSLCLISFLMLLSSCHYFSGLSRPSFLQKREVEYLSARSIPPLKIPAGLDSNRIHNAYPIPSQTNKNPHPVNIMPPGLQD